VHRGEDRIYHAKPTVVPTFLFITDDTRVHGKIIYRIAVLL